MRELIFDRGLEEIPVKDKSGEQLGILYVNPLDQNLFERVDAFIKNELSSLMNEYNAIMNTIKSTNDEVDNEKTRELGTLIEYDNKFKARLDDIFGCKNNFDQLLGGMNVMAIGKNGKPLIQNFLESILPILQEISEERHEQMNKEVDAALEQVTLNREQRRALKK